MVQMTRFKLLYFAHIIQRSTSLEKVLMLERVEGKRRGRRAVRWIDSVAVAMGTPLGTAERPD